MDSLAKLIKMNSSIGLKSPKNGITKDFTAAMVTM